jgi:hypothetical protein
MSVGSSYILKRVEIAVGKSKVHNDFPRRLRKRTSVGVSESFTRQQESPPEDPQFHRKPTKQIGLKRYGEVWQNICLSLV